jgi:primary-amine oxidase
MVIPHPLQHLNKAETELVVKILRQHHPDDVIEFRQISLQEPPKAELLVFLDLEHAGKITDTTARPARVAHCQYDTIGSDRLPKHNEAVVDLSQEKRIEHKLMGKDVAPSLTV